MKKLFGLDRRSGLAVAFIAATALSVSASDRYREHDDEDESQVKRGFDIVPPGVKLNLMGKNRALVGLGSYIVNTSGCIDCHSHPAYSPGSDPFKGEPERMNAEEYLSGGRTFGPTITAANITPDHAGKPAGLTRSEFVQMMRTGHNPKDPPGTIVQVMPWPVFGKKTDRDLAAIYEFLRAIPSLPDNTHPGP
ncbi:cytochrome C [Pseudoduganella aquatica]|uniref:Cytochrome C n=1 Tax=Pseudoduganella aquatica TaxID=2660641 RepID=A0A7X4H8Q6_9BURK|nr:cytochrome C [Pseudoduganella aquatica]MYN05977.1 cytochrome C [Pseudoduganella aquatica]